MIVVLPRGGIVFPGAAAEFRQPVVRRPATGARVTPDVPIAFRVVARTAALDEPGMLVGRVIGNEIENQLQAGGVRGLRQRVETFHGAEQRIDANVIGNVVTEISHRRGKDRGQPDRVDAERL